MKSSRWWPVMFLALGMAATACGSGDDVNVENPSRADEPIQAQEALPPECEKNWNWAAHEEVRSLVSWAPEERVDTAFISGPRESQNTAEYHDCQRFVLGPSIDDIQDFSGGIFSIFAVPKTDSVQAKIPDPVYAQAAEDQQALPAAQIFARAEYEELGIYPGFSCLYLFQDGNREWHARLRSDGWDEGDCGDPVLISELGSGGEWRSLEVLRREEPGATWEDYPVVARWIWHWTPQGFQEYKMGVWCDQGWCEVGGPAANAVTASFARGIPSGVGQTKQAKIQGWYDEQILAGYSDGALFPTAIVGTIIPEPDLGRHTEEHYQPGRWMATARVALTPLGQARSVPNPFQEKLNLALTETEGRGRLNRISLCRGPWEDGCQENGVDEPPPCEDSQIHRDETTWWARIESGGTGQPQTRYFCTARCPYDFEVAGSARWRWLEDDPGIWMRCINGCCEVRGTKN